MTVLGSGITVDGVLADHNDTDTYTVVLQAGQAYDFWVAGADTPAGLISPVPTLQDPVISITGPGGFPALADDDTGEGRNAAFRFVASTPGTYTITVGESDNTPGGIGGSYVLNFTDASFDPDISNHIFNAGALPGTDMILSQDDVLFSDISRAGDSDVVAVSLTGGTAYSFAMGTPDLADAVLRLLDGNGMQVAFDDSGGGGTAGFDITPGASGVYYLVAQDGSGSTGIYTLSFSSATPVDVPNTIQSTANLPLGVISGDIESNGDHDWYAIRLVAGTQYLFELYDVIGGNSLPDPELFLRDSTGVPIISDDNSGGALTAEITYTPSVSGLYFLDARDHGAGTGQFRLEARLVSTPTPPVHSLAGLDGESAGYHGSDLTDSITGGNASDTIDGADGADTLAGGDGGDSLLGGGDSDSLDGGTGTDTIDAGFGEDTVNGGDDADTLSGGGDNDTIDGGAGADSLSGGNDNDTVSGGDGNDTLDGGSGANQLNGGNDNDTFDNVLAGTTVSGGDGIDLVNTAVLDYTLPDDVENLTLLGTGDIDGLGNDLDNLIQGNGGNNGLTGGVGEDTIHGNGGNDLIGGGTEPGDDEGDRGNDSFTGDAGNDTLIGGAGADSLDGGSDNDAIQGRTGNDTVVGGLGDDALYGDAGADSLDGGDNSDSLQGGADNDTLAGGLGNDTLDGGDGNDTFDNVDGGDNVTAGAGIDQVNSFVSWTLAADQENLTLLGVNFTLGNGNGGNNVIFGNNGNNTLQGLVGADTVSGGAGNDTLIGGAGKDLNTGGGGLDHIKYNALSESGTAFANHDAINTFAHGDKIDLSAIDANTKLAGNQAFVFSTSQSLTHVAGQLIAQQVATSSFLVQADVNGDGAADFSLNVYTSPGFGTFHSFDFVL